MQVNDIVERISRGQLRAVSRCISWIENGAPLAQDILENIYSLSGKAAVIGVTGVPGSGKSTLVPALARRLIAKGHKPAILAVDPSSPISGGAILGDRIRDTLLGETAVFFRSVASRGNLGGLSRTLDDVVTLLDAAGFDFIIIETVGTGQSEIGVTKLAQTTISITAPGLGDEIQAMKAGILEVADIIVVNKADFDPRGAETAALTLRNAIAERQSAHGLAEGINNFASAERAAAWLPPVRAVSALRGTGLDELIQVVLEHGRFLKETSELVSWRCRRSLTRFHDALRDALYDGFLTEAAGLLKRVEEDVARGLVSPRRAAENLACEAIAGHRCRG